MQHKRRAAVSNLGRFRDSFGVTKTVRPRPDGYCAVQVQGTPSLLHVLVCTAFHGPRPTEEKDGKPYEVEHKDRNRSNNAADNLCWVTRRENLKESHRNKERRSHVPQTGKCVRARPGGNAAWEAYESVTEAARNLSLSRGEVTAIANGEKKSGVGIQCEWIAASELEEEEWRNVPDSTAAVSSLGRFRDSRGNIKTPQSSFGRAALIKVKQRSMCFHRVVCELFQGKAPTAQHKYVRHIDGNASNNLASNLAWATTINRSGRKTCAAQRSKPVLAALVLKVVSVQPEEEWVTYPSAAEAARQLHIPAPNIVNVANGKRSFAKDYAFSWVKGTPEQDRRSKPIRAGKRTVTISAPSSNLLNWQFFASTMEASRKLNIPSGNISNVCNGKQSIAGGYYFKWAPAQVPEVLPGEEWKIIDWL